MLLSGEDADEVNSAGQAIDIENVQLFCLSVATHKLATAQVIDHDLQCRFRTLHIKHSGGGVGEHIEKNFVTGLNTYTVADVLHTQVAHTGEDDVVHPSAVAAADDTRVLLVTEFEGVRAKIDREGGLRPAGGTRLAVHLGVVNVEFEEVIAVLRRDFAEIGDACSGGTVDRDEEFRLVVVGQVLFGTDAVVAGVGLLIGDEPWVVVGLPRL